MLYERWRLLAHQRRHEVALRDLNDGGRWTFEQLERTSECQALATETLAHPQGISPKFIFTVLQSWRQGRVVCPLEVGQAPPLVPPPLPHFVHLKTTSASAGTARMVAFTDAQLAADADNIVATMGLRPDWPNLGVISLAHSYGFSNLVLPLLLHGIPLCLLSSPLPEALRRAVATIGPCTLPAVPALWRAWHEARVLTADLHLAISAGAPLPLALEREVFITTGIKIHNFYGASECGGIAYDATTTPRIEATCVGAPMRNVRLGLAETGCLQVHSKAVGESYWPAASHELSGGIFQTSDLAELIAGKVYLRGRASDLINVAGRKVAPETIEAILRTHPEVQECLVFGIPAPANERSENIVACVAAKSTVSAAALQQFLLAHLPAWQVPREWHFEEFTANARGKLSRAEWRKKYADGK